jgi:RNA polymerase sigma-70 factor, ECF subfamily
LEQTWQSSARHGWSYGGSDRKFQTLGRFAKLRGPPLPVLKTESETEAGANLADLLRRAGAGDRSAFSTLYERTSAKLFGVIRRICTSEEAAREVLQETYVLIWKSASSFNPSLASPIAWMARIARNKAIDVRRLQAERISYLGVELDLDAPGFDPDPLASAMRNEELRRLTDCLKGLAADRREMILMAYYNGLSREEIGARFDRPANTVKTHLRRALAQLKECLDSND